MRRRQARALGIALIELDEDVVLDLSHPSARRAYQPATIAVSVIGKRDGVAGRL